MSSPHQSSGPFALLLISALTVTLATIPAIAGTPAAGALDARPVLNASVHGVHGIAASDRDAVDGDIPTSGRGSPFFVRQVYPEAFFFGASNLDTGNWESHPVWSANANAPRPANGYYRWRWQSGPVWADYFAQSLGLTAEASANGGGNYAFGAAGTSPHPGEPMADPGTPTHALYLSTQIDEALADHPGGLDGAAIYVFAIGDNDVPIFGRTPAEAPTAAGVVITQMQRLLAAGARRFVVRTLPPGQDPYATPFNNALLQGLPVLRAAGAKVYVVNAAEFVGTYLTVGYLAGIGITQFGPGINCRADAACQAAARTAALAGQIHDHTFLFFDAIGPHFNHRVHREMADHALLQLPLFENGFD